MKALGVGLGAFGFHDVWVERARVGRAAPRRHGGGGAPRGRGGMTSWHLSITHTDSVAIAYVVAS
jgi:holo-[acyl-carrier protein] synthase